MSAGGFADWLEAVQITPITPEKMRCVTEKNEVVRGENTPITPITPVTPQNAQGQTENTENAPAMQASAATPAPQGFDPAPAPRMGWLYVDQPWRELDRQYLAHWGQCPACQSASRHGERCATGQHLHDTYMAALPTT